MSRCKRFNNVSRHYEILMIRCFWRTVRAMNEPLSASLPQKKYYRQRAHSNPLADHCFEYPIKPEDMSWGEHYPCLKKDTDDLEAKKMKRVVEFVDVGCGYGGLLVELSTMFPETLMLGMEIRLKVSDYVRDRILALRDQHPGSYQNISVIRTNAMKYMVNFFQKGQIQKMFFLFPDPHFKKVKHKWRIINTTLLAEYAYLLAEGGMIYVATDVEDLYVWMTSHLDSHPLFEPLPKAQLEDDAILPLISQCTEEGKKVQRCHGKVHTAIYKRIKDFNDQS